MQTLTTHRLDAQRTTLLFGWQGGIPEVIYFGARLADDLDPVAFALGRVVPVGHATLDQHAPVSMQPEAARGFMGHPGFCAFRHERVSDWAGLFAFTGLREIDQGVVFSCTDRARELALDLICRLDPQTNVATFQSILTNTGNCALVVDWMSAPVLPVPQSYSEFISFSGRWCAEFTISRKPVPQGQTVAENRRGRTGKQAFPGIILLTPETGENNGACLGVHLAWSGNHKRILERLETGECQLQTGILNLPGECRLAASDSLQTPEIFVTHSDDGLNGMSHNLHAHVRKHILNFPDQTKARPVTVNTWEALYFDHNLDRLKALADVASKIGAERYVLDDGWFAGRNDDTSSLGDWYPDRQKYPDGLHPIVDYVVDKKRLEFGLWIEPEMVSVNSNLYRKHPDRVLQLQPYPLVEGRRQLVLDLNNPAVSACLYEQISALLGEYRISYLKWDMNRDHVLPGGQGGKLVASRQTRALYALIDRLRTAFPDVEIESCASGGGRIDYEILKRTHRFWTSDSNDAVERTRIQTGFSYFFPPEVMGAHIGPTWCHTSGRGFDAEFRALVASCGHMGLELDLTRMPDEHLAIFKQAVTRFKADRSIWHTGQFSRLTTVDPGLSGFAAVTRDCKSARAIVIQTDRPRSVISPPLKIAGLEPDRMYKISLQSDKIRAMRATRRFDNPLMNGGLSMTGNLIETVGIQLPVLQAQSALALALEGEGP